MIVTIINNDGTSKVLSYEQNSTFVQQCQKDSNHLLNMVISVSPNYRTFTTKEVPGGEVIKKHVNIAEKLPVKMRVKNSSQVSQKLQDEFHAYFKVKYFKGAFGSLKIRSQHSFIKIN